MFINTPPGAYRGNLRFYAWVAVIMLSAYILLSVISPHPGRNYRPSIRDKPTHHQVYHGYKRQPLHH
jgi:hypothetical protein